MANTFLGQKRLRKYYGKIREVLDMPNLIEVQKSSYDLFLKSGDEPQPADGVVPLLVRDDEDDVGLGRGVSVNA